MHQSDWQMAGRGARVGQVNSRLPFAVDEQGLLSVGVPAGDPPEDARCDFDVSINQSQLPRILKGSDVFERIGGTQLGVTGHGDFPLEPLDDVFRTRKRRHEFLALALDPAAGVVEMQV